ncbi:hypothetical protein NL676_035106 [Syzygium grande]|nr:hypothetical protein NL676_035106 [Syzygium grande]
MMGDEWSLGDSPGRASTEQRAGWRDSWWRASGDNDGYAMVGSIYDACNRSKANDDATRLIGRGRESRGSDGSTRVWGAGQCNGGGNG